MITRHPAGRGCWGGATVVLAIAGGLTATVLALGHAIVTQNDPAPATVAPVPAAQVVPATTTPDPATTTAQANSAPAAPRALVAVDPTTTQEITVANPPADPTTYPTDANGVRVAPPVETGNPPGTPGPQNGMDSNGNPVGPSPETHVGGQPAGQPPVG